MRATAIVPLAILLALGAQSAHAQSPPEQGVAPAARAGDSPTEARELYERGRALYQEGRYREAVDELERALTLDPTAAVLLYNIALVHEKLDDFDRAISYFRRYLQSGLPRDEHAQIEATIRRLEGARAHDTPEEPRVIRVAVPVTAPLRDEPRLGRADAVFWIAAGMAGAALATAALTGALALSAEAEVEQFVVDDADSRAARQQIADRADGLALATDTLLVSGATTALAAALLYAMRRKDSAEPGSGAAGASIRLSGHAFVAELEGSF